MTGFFTPKVKFIAITVNELFLVPLVIIVVYYFAPEYVWDVAIFSILCAAIFVAAKYYLVYPSLLDTGSYELYDLKGMSGVVTETVTPKRGKIRVGQEIWEARCDTGEIAPGRKVHIISRQSFVLNVEPIVT
jgi:membrane protein implicated in regulation of membrane protease activity